MSARADVLMWMSDHALIPPDQATALLNANDTAVRVAALREAAALIDSDDTCDCGGCDSCTVRKAAATIRQHADTIEQEHTP